MNRRAAVGLAFGALCLSVSAARASQVRSVNLEEMTAKAATIFAGRCLDVETVRDPALGRDVSVARFEVHRAIKGASGSIVTVRMALDDAGVGDAVSAFRKDEDVVLFLYGESPLGLRATVGLGQGRFKVVSDKRGRPIAMNELGNRNLMRALSPAASGRLARISDPGAAEAALAPTVLLDMAEALAAGAP